MGVIFALIVYWAPNMKTGEGEYPFSFYMILLVAYILHQVSCQIRGRSGAGGLRDVFYRG